MNVYYVTGLDDQQHQLAVGADFTSPLQRVDTAEESAANHGAAIGTFVQCAVQHSYAPLDSYSDQLLARWGIIRQVVADPTPDPMALPTEIPMYKVKNELIALDLDDDVEAWLASIPGKPGKRARNLWASAPTFLPEGDLGQAFKAYQGLTDQQFVAWCWQAYNSEG